MSHFWGELGVFVGVFGQSLGSELLGVTFVDYIVCLVWFLLVAMFCKRQVDKLRACCRINIGESPNALRSRLIAS